MNNTNRVLNRIILFIVGMLFLASGAVGILIMTVPTVGHAWERAGEGATSWVEQAIAASSIAEGSLSWVGIATVAAILVILALLVLALSGVAHRRTKIAMRSSTDDTPLGRVTVRESFVSDVVKSSLQERDGVLGAHVTANDVKGVPVLHVSVTSRQGTDTRELVDRLDHLLSNLTALTGRDPDALISVRSGLRARLAQDRRGLS